MLKFKSQYLVWQKGDGKQPTDIIHYAKSNHGIYEIYEGTGGCLMSYPRCLNRPADIFADLKSAKRKAKNVALFNFWRRKS